MPFGADVSGFLSNSIEHVTGAIASPGGLVNLVWIVLGWLAARAAASIFGEYVKRLWFRRVWRDEVNRSREQVAQLQASIAVERAEYDWAIACTERLLAENDDLLLRLIRAEALQAGAAQDHEPV